MNQENNNLEKATFAGGCFWCTVKPFDELPGIYGIVSGYTGGHVKNPGDREVMGGNTGHREAVQITFDPEVFPYEKLLDIYWPHIDPTDPGGQFYDRGTKYKTAIFYHNESQRKAAEASKQALEASGRFNEPIATEILPAEPFYPAGEKHQHYYKKNPFHYNRYYEGSGRKAFTEKHWRVNKKEEDLKQRLTDEQYRVTQQNATERPFDNDFHDNKREGIYVDVVSGEPLFSSKDQYDAGCGWPSFTKPLQQYHIDEELDTTHGMIRTEVRSKYANSHLGHLFNDGPEENGLRYCINSAALRFIPAEDLQKEGYGEYRVLFQEQSK